MADGQVTRRRLLKGLGALAVASMTAGCALGRTSAPGTSDASAQIAAGVNGSPPIQSKRGGSVTIGIAYPILSTNPHPQSPGPTSFRGALFNQLVGLDNKLQPIPDLAQSWTLASDGLGLTLALRQGVKFHTGKDFTAEEAKWNIDYAKDPKSRAQQGRDLAGVTATVKGKYELELRFESLLPQIFSLLTDLPIIEPSSNLEKTVSGTGPFKLDSFSSGDELRTVRNDAYWRKGYPLLDAYNVKVFADDESLVAAVASGSIQLADSPLASDAARLSNGATRVVTLAGSGNYDILVTCSHKPFDDKRVRQALGLALDRKRFVDTALAGQSYATYIAWPKSSPMWDSALDTGELNLSKAKQLLADAGYGAGFQATLQTSTAAAAELTQLAQLARNDLARIGATVTVQDMAPDQWVTSTQSGAFDLVAHRYSFADQDPALLFTSTPFVPGLNASHFNAAEYTRMVQAAQQERDPEKRLALYRDLTVYLKDQAFVLPVANRPQLYALRANLQGFKTGPFLTPVLEGAWLE